ncbi:MAG TPA: hypothetical protein ENF94_01685 [Candidatus Woesearchaeota archaeon]|nr:hypothetical protein [Candidatus Woesearchaeota archaeon]
MRKELREWLKKERPEIAQVLDACEKDPGLADALVCFSPLDIHPHPDARQEIVKHFENLGVEVIFATP